MMAKSFPMFSLSYKKFSTRNRILISKRWMWYWMELVYQSGKTLKDLHLLYFGLSWRMAVVSRCGTANFGWNKKIRSFFADVKYPKLKYKGKIEPVFLRNKDDSVRHVFSFEWYSLLTFVGINVYVYISARVDVNMLFFLG